MPRKYSKKRKHSKSKKIQGKGRIRNRRSRRNSKIQGKGRLRNKRSRRNSKIQGKGRINRLFSFGDDDKPRRWTNMDLPEKYSEMLNELAYNSEHTHGSIIPEMIYLQSIPKLIYELPKLERERRGRVASRVASRATLRHKNNANGYSDINNINWNKYF